MEKIILITRVLNYIEANLTEDIKTDDIAKEMFCSKSSIEKLFKTVTNMSIKDYSIRRRMSRAAKDMLKDSSLSLLDLALRYGYSSNEAFTRAFKNVWHQTPSEFRKNPVRFELFPALKLDKELMEDRSMSTRIKLDISELYDYIKERNNCYFIGVDIRSLIPINDISFEAGDLAILTALRRLEDACSKDDIVFRVGGDEFVALTNSDDREYVNKVVAEILSHNGECIEFDGQNIPLNLYVTSYKLNSESLRYAELFSTMQSELSKIK